jgi:beta-fructofuranosidase
MYFTPGYNPNELGDFDVVEHDGKLHCFYLCLTSHDQIGHLVSEDGINWEPLPTAIRTGDPGQFDDDQLWTMGVFRRDGLWFMLYTALSERGFMQRIGLATSEDLNHWTKYKDNPVLSADERWYEAVQTGNYRIDWRDPHVIEHGGVLHGFLCARKRDGLLNRRGCAAYFTSNDGYHWEAKAPAATTSNCFDYECPSVFELDGKFYMAAIGGGIERMVYRIAESVEGPYRAPADDSLLPGMNMSVRPCRFKGRVHLFHWQFGTRDWGSGSGGNYHMLASPKAVCTAADGTLVTSSFDWSAQYEGQASLVDAATPAASSCGDWAWSQGTLSGTNADGAAIYQPCEEYADYIISAEVTLCPDHPAREFGLLLRGAEMGDLGLFASYIPGRFRAEMVKYVYNHRRGPDSLWRGRSVLQEHHCAPANDGKYQLKVVVFGPSIEFNVNGRLVLATMSLPRRYGSIGLFCEDGSASFSNVIVQPLKSPRCNWDF